jgi:hypothetical protein
MCLDLGSRIHFPSLFPLRVDEASHSIVLKLKQIKAETMVTPSSLNA